MSFTVEVSGDANPLSLPELCRALESATSADFARRQVAGQQLASWENVQGYYSSLQTVFLDKSLPTELRFLAVIQLKNGIDRHWRLAKTTSGGIQPEEKDMIRQRLFQGTLDEEEKSLALHNSLAAARIIRVDYPRQWPEALSTIIGLLRSSKEGSQQHLNGALQILLQVVKEMSTARLRTSQTALQSVTPEMAYVLGEIYAERTPVWEAFFKERRGDEDVADMAMSNSLLALKILRRLVISGYEAPHKDKTVQQLWSLSQNQFGEFLKFVSQDSAVPAPYQDTIGKHILHFTKLHIDMATSRPASFASLPSSLPLVHAYWSELVIPFADVFEKSEGIRQTGGDSDGSKSKAEGPLLEKLTTRALLLIKACLDLAYLPKHTFVYRGPESREEEKQAVAFVKDQLFTDEFALSMANTILTKLFVFRQSDLEAWEEDPEEWEHLQRFESLSYGFEVRPCAEKVFLVLLQYKKELLGPRLLSYMATATTPQADFATKDSVYTAMGLAAMHIASHVDFNSFVTTTLVPDAQQTGPHSKILRRRISILLGQWVFEYVNDETRGIIYQMFRHFISSNDDNNDLVVQISAARNLQFIVDDLDFKPDVFAPHAGDILRALGSLIREVSNDETRLTLLETMRLVVTRLESHVDPFGDFVMDTIGGTFLMSGAQEYMTKTAVVGIFSALVMSMRTKSQCYHEMMVPLISDAASPTSDLHTSLIDDVLDLWNSMLIQSTPPISNRLTELAPSLLPVLEYTPETAGLALDAVESYILMAPQAVLTDDLRRPFLNALAGILEVRSREQVKKGAQCIEYIIRAAEELGGTSGVSVVVQDMLESGFMKAVLEKLHDAWEARQTTGPKRRVPKLNTVAEGDYFIILARLALVDPGTLIDMLTSFGALDQLWPWLMGEWFAYIESQDNVEHEKLTLMGLTRLMELNRQPIQDLVLGRLQDLMLLWANTVAELQNGTTDNLDSLIWTESEFEGSEYDTQKDMRERQLCLADPIHRVAAKGFVKERLQGLIERVGGESRFQEEWMSNVDKDVVDKFSRFVMN